MARGSVVTPVWRPNMKVVSTTASASAKALSGVADFQLALEAEIVAERRHGSRGVLASSAVSGSVTAGSGS